MQELKITKLRGGYSADAELVFRSWRADILANIQDTKRGATVYDSPDQPYSFQKHVRFRYRPNQPDLESDVAG